MKRTTLTRKTPLRSRSRLRAVGRRGKRLASPDKVWRLAVWNRWHGCCALCSRKQEGMEAHHIYGKQANPHLRHVLVNGALLCPRCHDYAHQYPETVRASLLQHLTPAEFSELAEWYTTGGVR